MEKPNYRLRAEKNLGSILLILSSITILRNNEVRKDKTFCFCDPQCDCNPDCNCYRNCEHDPCECNRECRHCQCHILECPCESDCGCDSYVCGTYITDCD